MIPGDRMRKKVKLDYYNPADSHPFPSAKSKTEQEDDKSRLTASYQRIQEASHLMQRSKMSSFFKSKQPKIALYNDLERKLKDSQREEPRIIVITSTEKLEDFKKEPLRVEHRTMQGNLMKGKSLTKPAEPASAAHLESRSILEQQPSISPLGPGQYQVKDQLLKRTYCALPFAKTGRYKEPSNPKHLMESYIQKILDLNAQRSVFEQSLIMESHVDKRQPLSSLMSKTLRMSSLKEEIPGPGFYEVTPQPRPQRTGGIQSFGTLGKRESMLIRDISKSPFMDPTNKLSPSPVTYQKQRSRNGLNTSTTQ